MPAFLTCDAIVKGADALTTCLLTAAPWMQRLAAKFIVNADSTGAPQEAERPEVVMIADYRSIASARKWYEPQDHAKGLAFRNRVRTRGLVLVEGLEIAVD